jgi:DNA-directed RNA polymerase subunit RPC12/RpoP
MSTDRITFKCADCEQPVFLRRDPKDDDVVSCDKCGRQFGTYSDVRAAMIEHGKSEFAGLVDEANLPPAIIKK